LSEPIKVKEAISIFVGSGNIVGNKIKEKIPERNSGQKFRTEIPERNSGNKIPERNKK